MSQNRVEVQPLTGALGAEVLGFDLSRSLDNETFSRIADAFNEHLVLFFRDQELTTAQHCAFAARFGKLIPHPFVQGLPDYPEVIKIVREPGESYSWDGKFHSDLMFLDEPPLGAALYAKEVPPYGGDTEFVNMYMAYETLSDGMKRLLQGLEGENESGPPSGYYQKFESMHEKENRPMGTTHPLVRVHPATGRKALFVSPGFTKRIKGMADEESRPILDFLCNHAIRPQFMCRFRWRPGSLALWDNRVSLHHAIADFYGEVDGYRRVMHRATIAGDRPIAA